MNPEAKHLRDRYQHPWEWPDCPNCGSNTFVSGESGPMADDPERLGADDGGPGHLVCHRCDVKFEEPRITEEDMAKDTRAQGNKHENEAEELYERCGFETERSNPMRFGRSDWFGLFDLMAVQPYRPIRFVQVRTNVAKGVTEYFEQSLELLPSEHVEVDFLVRHTKGDGERASWRLLRAHREGDRLTYRTVVDERDMGCERGAAIVEWLRGQADV